MALHILNLGTKWTFRGKLQTLGKEPWYPLNSMLGASTNGLDVWEETEVSYTCHELNHDPSSGVQPVS